MADSATFTESDAAGGYTGFEQSPFDQAKQWAAERYMGITSNLGEWHDLGHGSAISNSANADIGSASAERVRIKLKEPLPEDSAPFLVTALLVRKKDGEVTEVTPHTFVVQPGQQRSELEVELHPLWEEGAVHEVGLLQVEIDSRDRAVTGKIPHLGSTMGGNKKLEIGFLAGGKSLGKHEIPQSGSPQGVHIYNSEEEIFGPEETEHLDGLSSEKKNQQVVLVREGSDIRFYTVSDDISTFKVQLYLDGSLIGTVDHQLKAEDDFERLIAAVEGFVNRDNPPAIKSFEGMSSNATNNGPPNDLPEAPNNHSDWPDHKFASVNDAAPPVAQAGLAADGGPATLRDPMSMLFFIYEVKAITEEENDDAAWQMFIQKLNSLGYNTAAALAPAIENAIAGFLGEEEGHQDGGGWWFHSPGPVKVDLQLPSEIRKRGLIAKILIPWTKKEMKMAVAGGEGMVFGIWDGIKSEWEDIKQFGALWEALKNPYKSASELYHSFKQLKDMTSAQWKDLAMQMFNSFLDNSQNNLAWTDPETADEALKHYMTGYLTGYIAEQVAVAGILGFFTGGASLAIKAGKAGTILKTVFEVAEKAKGAIKVTALCTVIENRLPKVFIKAFSRIVSYQDLMRRIRAVSSRVKKIPMPAKLGDCTHELAYSRGNGRLRRSLGGTVGDNLQAHHLLPWEQRTHPLVIKAARGGFNINNGDHNGILLPEGIHQGVKYHPEWGSSTKEMLDVLEKEAANLTDGEAADLLLEASSLLRLMIQNAGHPLTKTQPMSDSSRIAFVELRFKPISLARSGYLRDFSEANAIQTFLPLFSYVLEKKQI